MGDQGKTKDNLVAQAGILVAAGFISRIIGLLYNVPLRAVIGETGYGAYTAAYDYYVIVLLLASYSIPSAISKLIAPKLAAREYRNAHRLFYCAMGYVLVVGLIASLGLFFCAGVFVPSMATPVLRVLAPTIFVYGMLGVLRGYFQAHRSMVQTSVSQVIEQIANAIVSIGGAWILMHWGISESFLANESPENKQAVLGAMGSATGTGVGVLTGLLFMAWIYVVNRKMILNRIRKDKTEQVDSYRSMIRSITMVLTPFIMSTAIYQVNKNVINYLYNTLVPSLREQDGKLAGYGIYGTANVLFNIPLAFATAMASAMIPSIAQASASGDMELAKENIHKAVKTTMILSIPSAVGLFALAKPLIYSMYPDKNAALTARVLMVLAPAVILYALSTVSNSILQGLGKVNVPVVNAAVALGVQAVVAFVLLMVTDLDLVGIAITNILYAAIICVLNQLALRRVIDYRQEWKTTYLRPVIAALVMGVAARGTYELLQRALLGALDSTRIAVIIAVIPAVIFGVVVYFVVLLSLKTMSEEELKDLPKGHVLVKIAKKCKLL